MRAHQIMSRHVVTVGVDASVADAIATMLEHRIGGLPVVDALGRLVGIVSEGDFIRRAEIGTERKRGRWLTLLAGTDRIAIDFTRSHGRRIGEIMTANPITISQDTPLQEIVAIMEAHNVKRLPVVSGDIVIGMVTQTDFLQAIARLAGDREKFGSDSAGSDDGRIRDLVIAALTDRPWRPYAMRVDVQDGVVKLSGNVRSRKSRQAAIVAAEGIAGVHKVEDDLTVYPASEADYGGGDFVSLPEEATTADDRPL